MNTNMPIVLSCISAHVHLVVEPEMQMYMHKPSLFNLQKSMYCSAWWMETELSPLSYNYCKIIHEGNFEYQLQVSMPSEGLFSKPG